MSLVSLVFLVLLAQAGPPAAQPPQPAQSLDPSAALDADELPVSLERIREALAQQPAIRLQGDKPVFRVEVFGRKPTIEDILGPDFFKGPVKYGGMTHQEFLDMVTPRDVQGYAAFNNKEAAVVAATSFAMKWALLKAIDKYKEARDNREREAARKEVEEALQDLDRARARAGLPPR